MRDKPTLLLLPGMLCDADSWRAQVHDLADVCAPHVMEYGLADSVEAMALAVLERAPDAFALAGHSMGGRVALEVYKRAPKRVRALALLATDYRGHASAADYAQEEARRTAMLAAVESEGMRAFAQGWVKTVVAPERLGDGALVQDVVAMMARQSAKSLAAQSMAGLTRPDYAALLPRIACPTLICAGDKDALRPVSIHHDMASRISGSRLVVAEVCGHMIAMERPHIVTSAMREWLRGLV